MKIIYLSSASLPSESAHSVQIVKMVDAFQSADHDVRLFRPRSRSNGATTGTKFREIYGLNSDIDSTRVPWLPTSLGTAMYVVISLLVFWIHVGRPDLVVTREANLSMISSVLRFNTAVEIHQIPTSRFSRWSLKYLLRKSTRSNRVTVVGISDGIRQDVLDNFNNDESRPDIKVLPSGVDITLFEQPTQENDISSFRKNEHGSVLVYAGSFFKGKGADQIVEIAKKMPRSDFILVGGRGDDLTRVQSLITDSRLENVHTRGYVAHREVPNWLALADILLLPLQESVEASGGQDIGRWTSPMKLYEYMAANRPICVSDLPILREAVSEDEVRFLPASDADAWVSGIEELLRDSVTMAKLSAASNGAANLHSWHERANTLVNWSTKVG